LLAGYRRVVLEPRRLRLGRLCAAALVALSGPLRRTAKGGDDNPTIHRFDSRRTLFDVAPFRNRAGVSRYDEDPLFRCAKGAAGPKGLPPLAIDATKMVYVTMPDAAQSGREGSVTAGRGRCKRSDAQELIGTLKAVDFGSRIIIFGASMLLSVLPLIVLVSAFANRDVDNSISQRLGLNHQAARIVDSLFTTSPAAFNSAIVLSLAISAVGTILVARSVQELYERTFDKSPAEGKPRNLLRCAAWVISLAVLIAADAATSKTLLDLPAGPLVLGLVDFAAMTLFFWWSVHFLLGGREPGRRIVPSAIATAVFWLGFGVFASFYFSPTIVSDSRLYGLSGLCSAF
jgi:membrane protein